MKRLSRSHFNLTALIGLVGGITLLVIAIATTATAPLSFLNFPSVILVVGGTFMATLVTYTLGDLRAAGRRALTLLRRVSVVDQQDATRFVRIAGDWKSGKLHSIEGEIEGIKSPFMRTGLRLLVDGMPGDAICTVLDWRMREQEARELKEAAVFRSMATYAPAFGMAGTLIGLVNMLRLMGEGVTPELIGQHLAFALITTLYGLVLANALFKPIAAKIETKTYEHLRVMSAIAEAFREIGAGHGASHVREMLLAISENHESEMDDADVLDGPKETPHAANAAS